MQISNACDTLEKVLNKLAIDVRHIEVVAGDPHPMLSISTPDSALLIGPQGEHLRALNYLVKKLVEGKNPKQKDEPGFLVDVNGYHRKHIMALKQQAGILAERARAYKAEVAMSPLSSYERMIIHATYADDPDIYTESAHCHISLFAD